MRFIRKTVFFFRHYREILSVLWAHQHGRWYCFRDTSDAVVGAIADIDADAKGVSDELKAVVAEAVAERQRRRARTA